jgi:ribonuclease Z
VVLSGDTRFSENLIKYAKGTDVLVHEVIAADMMRAGSLKNAETTERVIAHHTTPEKAGEIFNRVQPKLAVYNHIIPVTATAKDLVPPTFLTYQGPLEVGEDLMSIEIGEEVTVHRTGR